MRYELSDHEWTAIKPMLPNSRAAFGVQMTVACSMASFGSYVQVRHGATCQSYGPYNYKDPICFSPHLYCARNLIERFFTKIKQCRRVATRYDKLAANYLAFIKLASIRIWLRAHESTP